jgi:hypothetical protein
VTIGTGITVHGSGIVQGLGSASMINRGAILADIAGGRISIYDVVNRGLIRVSDGATLEASGLAENVNSGTVVVDAGGKLVFTFGTMNQLGGD